MNSNNRTQSNSSKCLCGCGQAVAGRFRQGHDMKLRSLVTARMRGERGIVIPRTQATREYLAKAPWMTAEIAKALHL